MAVFQVKDARQLEDLKAELEMPSQEEIEEMRAEIRNLQRRVHRLEKRLENKKQ